MDCREFRNNHVAFVDDLLSAYDMDAMQQHLQACAKCARQNTAVLRSLLLVRNLPPIQPSPEFMSRLNDRLERLGPSARFDVVAPRPFSLSLGAFAAVAAGVAAVAYIAVETAQRFAHHTESPPPPIVAVQSHGQLGLDIADAALVASVPTAMPVWPAVLMAGQTPMHFAAMDFTDAGRPR